MSNYFDKFQRTFLYDTDRMMPMPESPFVFRSNASFRNLVGSIEQYGLLEPIVVIPHPKYSGKYEIVSGVRRWMACRELDYTNISCIVADNMTRDEALIFMVDSNLCNRDYIPPTEKGKAYKLKLEVMARQGHRSDLDETCTQPMHKLKSVERIGEENDESRETVRRLIRLTELIPELQELVDDRRIALGPAVELSYLPEDMQRAVYDYYAENEVTPSYSQANQMKKRCNDGTLTPQALTDILNQPKPNQVEMFRIPADRIRPFLDPKLPKDKMLDVIVKALEYYARAMERKKRDHGAR